MVNTWIPNGEPVIKTTDRPTKKANSKDNFIQFVIEKYKMIKVNRSGLLSDKKVGKCTICKISATNKLGISTIRAEEFFSLLIMSFFPFFNR